MAHLIPPLPPLGFGAFKIGRNQGIHYAQAYDLPDEPAAAVLLNTVLDLGINYIDTAPAYGLSEERIGRALAHRRREFVLSTKVGETFHDGQSTYDFSAAAVRRSIERSLRRLKTDVLDIVFVHAHRDDLAILEQTDVAPTLLALRDAGHVRAVGFSGYTAPAFRVALTWCDAIMVAYHAEDPSLAPILDEAAARGIAVVVKKGLASGRLPPAAALAFALAHPAVHSVVVGSLNIAHLHENLRIAERARPTWRRATSPAPMPTMDAPGDEGSRDIPGS